MGDSGPATGRSGWTAADVAYWSDVDGPAVDVLPPLWRMLQAELWRLEALDGLLDVPPVLSGHCLAERLQTLWLLERQTEDEHSELGRSVPLTDTERLDAMAAEIVRTGRYVAEQTGMLRHAMEHYVEALDGLRLYVAEVLAEQTAAPDLAELDDTDGQDVEDVDGPEVDRG